LGPQNRLTANHLDPRFRSNKVLTEDSLVVYLPRRTVAENAAVFVEPLLNEEKSKINYLKIGLFYLTSPFGLVLFPFEDEGPEYVEFEA
jgi:hypothetical protein